MTRNERDILEFCRSFFLANSYFPTFREIAVGVGLSRASISTVSSRMNMLVRAGHLVRFGRRFSFPDDSNDETHKRAVGLLRRLSPGEPPAPKTSLVIDQIARRVEAILQSAAFKISDECGPQVKAAHGVLPIEAQ